MNIDVINILWLQIGISKCTLHNELSTKTFWMRSCDVISISTLALTHHLSINLRTTSLSVLQFLENQATSTFAHDKSITACAEWT